jgi:hypothetical protein
MLLWHCAEFQQQGVKDMTGSSGKTQEIWLGSDFDPVARYGGARVELKSGGAVIGKTEGNVVVSNNSVLKIQARRQPASGDTLIMCCTSGYSMRWE